MAIDDHVKITITSAPPALTREGFGVPAIMSHTAGAVYNAGEYIRYYSSTAGVTDDFAATTVEYLAASAMFAQTPAPDLVGIAAMRVDVTQQYTFTIADVIDNHDYVIRVRDSDTINELATFTSGGGTDNDTIVAGVVGALNGVAGKNYTAAIGGVAPNTTIIATCDAANNWFSLEVLSRNDFTAVQTHADPGMATSLGNLLDSNRDWYAVVTLYNSPAYVLAVATWVESNTRLYVFDIDESAAVTTAVSSGDAIDTIKTTARRRTLGNYHPSPYDMYSAALFGRVLPRDPGSVNWKFNRLSGPSPVALSTTERLNLRNKNGNSYEAVSGASISFEGSVGSGEWIDVVRGVDWIDSDMSTNVLQVLINEEKVGYTDADFAKLEQGMRQTLRTSVTRRILASFAVIIPKVANVDPTDRANRVARVLRWSGILVGAVNTAEIDGTIAP